MRMGQGHESKVHRESITVLNINMRKLHRSTLHNTSLSSSSTLVQTIIDNVSVLNIMTRPPIKQPKGQEKDWTHAIADQNRIGEGP